MYSELKEFTLWLWRPEVISVNRPFDPDHCVVGTQSLLERKLTWKLWRWNVTEGFGLDWQETRAAARPFILSNQDVAWSNAWPSCHFLVLLLKFPHFPNLLQKCPIYKYYEGAWQDNIEFNL